MDPAVPASHGKLARQQQVHRVLTHIWSFLETYLPLANSHGADFLTQAHWQRLLPAPWRSQLLALSRQQLVQLSQFGLDPNSSTPGTPATTPGTPATMPGTPATTPGTPATGQQPQAATSYSHDAGTEIEDEDGSFSSFIAEAARCHLENTSTLSTISDIMDSTEQMPVIKKKNQSRPNVVCEGMSEKKSHEIEAISSALMALTAQSQAEIIIDVGSGKGYLGCELSLRHKIPVIGLDSCDTNTHGALMRDEKITKRWHKQTQNRETKNRDSQHGCGYNPTQSRDSTHGCGYSPTQSGDSSHRCEYNQLETIQQCASSSSDISRPSGSSVSLQSNRLHMTDQVSCPDVATPDQMSRLAVTTPDLMSRPVVATPDQMSHPAVTKPDLMSHPAVATPDQMSRPAVATSATSLYVPLTLAVHPDMNLCQIVERHASKLGIRQPSSARILCTGLHACGSLSVTAMRLLLHNPAVVSLCVVGCCYQLMEESCQDPADEVCGQSPTAHFPLSQFGQQLGLRLGRNARNLASQSVDRMQASGQLQGADFCWRAMLELLLHELRVPVPDKIVGMRKLHKRSQNFLEYVRASLSKLHLDPDLAHPELVASIEARCGDLADKMAAFVQVKLVLAPVIEAVVLLDRYLYLLEQDSVRDAHIVRLFEPVISPRCHAIVAWK